MFEASGATVPTPNPTVPPTPAPAAPVPPAPAPAQPPVQAAPPVPAPQPTSAPAPQPQDPKWLPQRLERERKKMEKEAELAVARKYGYDSVEAFNAAVEAARKAEDAGKTELQRANDRAAKAEKEAQRLQADLRREQDHVRRVQQEAEDDRLMNDLRAEAKACGVNDAALDFAVQCLIAKASGLSDEDQMDPKAYFSTEMKQTHPFFFATVERPASTTPPGQGATPPAPPAPGSPQPTADATKLDPQAWQTHLKKYGAGTY